jgi:hypothetical protein
MDADDVIATFGQGALTGSQLQRAIDEAQADVVADGAELRRLGVDPEAAAALRFRVEESAGVDPGSVALAIAIGAASALTADGIKALLKLVLDRVRGKKGDDAVGAEVADEAEPEAGDDQA